MGPETAKNARVLCDTICSENIGVMHDISQNVALINKKAGMYLSQICQCLKAKNCMVMFIHCCKIDKRNSSCLHFLQCCMRFTCNEYLNCMRLYLVHRGLVQHILARFMKGIFIFEMLTLLSWFVIMSWVNNLDVLFPSFIFASCLYYFRFSIFVFITVQIVILRTFSSQTRRVTTWPSRLRYRTVW